MMIGVEWRQCSSPVTLELAGQTIVTDSPSFFALLKEWH